MNVDINTNSRTEPGRKQILKELASATSGIDRHIDLLCWNMYNNEHKEADYDYLRKYGEYVLPAHVRHIPKQRPYIDYLTARQMDRPYVFSVTAIDKESLERKHKNIVDQKVKMYIEAYRQRHYQINTRIQQLELQRQQIMEALSQQPQDQQQAMALQQAKMMKPQITAELDNARDTLVDMQVVNDKDMERFKMFQRTSDKEMMEMWAQKACRSYRQRLSIKSKSTQNFINSRVTGKQYYYVDYRPGDKTITYRTLVPHKVFYQHTDDVMWTHELDWAGFEEFMTPVDTIREFGSGMSPDERRSISTGDFYLNGSSDSGPFVATPGDKAVDMGRDYDNGAVSSGSSLQEQGVSVKRVWWVAERQARRIMRPNPYRKGKYFSNILSEDKKVIDEKDYFYKTRDRKWINKKDEEITWGSDGVKTFNSEKGDKFETRFIYDRYKGVIINNQIFISEKDPIQPRGVDNLSKTWLPIIGPTFNNITFQPYSSIWATKDLQKSYNIVHYHRELMMAVAGTKAFLMDKSQKPDALGDEEWDMQKKLGNIMIETRKKGIGQLPPSFNQFQVIDMSLSASIQYFDAILESIDNQMGLILGVTRQAMGQTVNSDQVGTFELSQRSTLLITQVLYAQHDEIERQALNMMLRLAKQYILNEETIIQLIEGNGGESIFRIPAGKLNKADFDIIVENNSQEESSLIELKQLALQNYKAGLLPFQNFIAMYRVDSLIELEKMSEYFAEKAQELESQSAMAEGERAKELEQQKGELAMQLAQFTEQQRRNTEKMKLDWEQAKQKSEDIFRAGELELKKKETELKEQEMNQTKYLEVLKLSNTKESEDNVIVENARATNLDAKIRMFELQLQQIQAILNKDSENKKINVEDKKASKMVKEHTT